MIYTKKKYLSSYQGIHKNLDTAIDYLMQHELSELAHGRNEVDGENVFINRFDYETLPEEETAFEAHEHYADIHLLLSGKEQIGISDIANMEITGRDTVNDSVDCKGIVEARVPMSPNEVLIAFPEDAHMVKLQLDEKTAVEKAVVKVLLD